MAANRGERSSGLAFVFFHVSARLVYWLQPPRVATAVPKNEES